MEDVLSVERARQGEIAIITSKGDVDMESMPQLREAVRQEIAGGAVHLILDMRGVSYMDSSGMSIIMTSKKLAEEHHGKVYLITLPGAAARALELVKVHHLVELADTPEAALEALQA